MSYESRAMLFDTIMSFPGDFSGGATPVPIPNTAVKPSSPDGTAWVTVWESRTLPGINSIQIPAVSNEAAGIFY